MRKGLIRTDSRRGPGGVVVVAIAVAVLVLALLVGLFFETRRGVELTVGVSITETDGGVIVETVEEGKPAANAGLAGGDQLRSIDGHSITSFSDYDLVAADFLRGVPVSYRVERSGNLVSLEVSPGVAFPIVSFSVVVLAALLHLLLGLWVLLERSSSLRGRLLIVLSLSVAVELALPTANVGRPVLGAATLAIFGLLAGLQYAVELHLASLIPQRHPWFEGRRWAVPCFYAVGLSLGVVLFGSSVPGLDQTPLFAWALTDGGILVTDMFYVLWPLGVVAILASAAIRWPQPVGRQQALLVLLGSLPWAILSVGEIVMYYGGLVPPVHLELMQALALVCFPVAVFAAFYRYKLFDLELVVRRSLVYTALTTTLVLVFVAVVWLGGGLVAGLLEEQRVMAWVIGGTTLLLGLAFAPLRNLLQNQIEAKFFPERKLLRESLISLARDLPGQGNIQGMGEKLADELCAAFDARSALLFLSDPESGVLVRQGEGSGDVPKLRAGVEAGDTVPFLLPTEQLGVQALGESGRPVPLSALSLIDPEIAHRLRNDAGGLLVPLLRHEEMIGLVALGRKRDGSEYNGEEQELLALVAHHVGAVFENARLFQSATQDGLTGLQRRGPVLEVAGKELRRALRYERPLTLGMADIDGFKYINDVNGHLAGDLLLRRVGQVLKNGLRASDVLGRYGGDEFLILLPETDSAAALGVAEKIRARIERERIKMESGTVLQATVSIGLASLADLHGVQGPTVASLLGMADEALYRAKREGRNRVRLPVHPMRALS